MQSIAVRLMAAHLPHGSQLKLILKSILYEQCLLTLAFLLCYCLIVLELFKDLITTPSLNWLELMTLVQLITFGIQHG